MRILLIAALLAAAACTRDAQQSTDAQPALANDCPAAATTTWESFTIAATAEGADCAQAQATLTITGANGAVAYTELFPVAQVMVLAGAQSTADMERMLNEWISPPGAAADSTGDLPEWTANAEYPVSGEFPFYPQEGVDRASYEAIRRGDAPMFCFVQGMESQSCVMSENGAVRVIGVQTFPG
jgi:hypothetical protein